MPPPTDKKSQRLAQLAALAQVYTALSAPQEAQAREEQQAQGQQQAHLLTLLGLMQQGKTASGEQALQQKHYDAVLGEQQNVSAEGVRHDKAIEAQNADNSAMSLVHGLLQRPDVPIDTVMKLLPPSHANESQIYSDIGTQSKVNQVLPALQAAYGGFANDPHKAQSGLDAVWQTLPQLRDPKVFAAIQPELDRLNAGVPQGPNPAGGPVTPYQWKTPQQQAEEEQQAKQTRANTGQHLINALSWLSDNAYSGRMN